MYVFLCTLSMESKRITLWDWSGGTAAKFATKLCQSYCYFFFIKIYGPFAFCCCLVWTTSAHCIHLFVYLCFMCRERNIAVQRESSNNRSIFCMEKATTKMAKKIWCTSIISITHYRVTTLTHLLTLLPDLHASTLRATFLHHICTYSQLSLTPTHPPTFSHSLLAIALWLLPAAHSFAAFIVIALVASFFPFTLACFNLQVRPLTHASALL